MANNLRFANVSIIFVIAMDTSELQCTRDMEWAMYLNRLSLEICGMWPNENRSSWRKFCADVRILFFALVISIVILFPQTMAMIKVWGHLTLVSDNLMASMPSAVTLCKIFTLWQHKKVIITMMTFVENDWMKMKSNDERDVMLKHAKIARTITICGYASILAVLIFYFPPAIFGIVARTVTNLTDTGDRPLVFQTVYFYDVYRSPIYELTLLSQAIAGSLVGFCYTTLGTVFGAIVLHVCSQLENLRLRIDEMAKTNVADFRKMLKLNIVEHQRLIAFVDLIEHTFNLMLLAVATSFSIILCVQAIEIINLMSGTDGSLVRTAFHLTYVSWTLFIMFVYSAVGELLVVRSETLTLAVYNCDWFNLTARQAAQIIPILVRSQRPFHITLGKFIPLRLPTFAYLLKTTAGYMSFLLAVKE